MKFSALFSSPGLLILLLSSVLLTTPALAQSTESEPAAATPPVRNPKAGPDTEQATTKAKTPALAPPPAATRFIPSEKIHADDAVSFPVDI